jgi:hypothetical protein
MSFCDQMSAAIDGARTLTRLDHLSRSIWQGLAAGAVGDDDAQALAERLHAHRGVLRGEIKPVGIPVGRPSIFPPRRLQRAAQRPVAIARRRHLAASGPMQGSRIRVCGPMPGMVSETSGLPDPLTKPGKDETSAQTAGLF